jgi:hypothetical protein
MMMQMLGAFAEFERTERSINCAPADAEDSEPKSREGKARNLGRVCGHKKQRRVCGGMMCVKDGSPLGRRRLRLRALARQPDPRALAREFARKIKSTINTHGIQSPIEQIFLMEWNFLGVEHAHGVRLEPQKELSTPAGTVKIDFAVTGQPKLNLAIEYRWP